jgi:hypothetical protein
MPHQPNLFSSSSSNGSAVPDRKPVPPHPARIRVWLRRIELLFYVILRIYVGVIVIVLPWTPLWSDNNWINYFPGISAFLMHGAVRGIISGLGLLNLYIAVDEATHYRESAS